MHVLHTTADAVVGRWGTLKADNKPHFSQDKIFCDNHVLRVLGCAKRLARGSQQEELPLQEPHRLEHADHRRVETTQPQDNLGRGRRVVLKGQQGHHVLGGPGGRRSVVVVVFR